MGAFKSLAGFLKKILPGKKPEKPYQKRTASAKSAKPVQEKEKCNILKPFQNHGSYINEMEKLSRKLNTAFSQKSSEPTRVKELREEVISEIFNTSAGDQGEKLVYDKLCSIPKKMALLHDFYLSGQDSAQCDFILITSRLILVLECKHWKSEMKISYDTKNKKLICGDYDDPLEQNQNHIRFIKSHCRNSEIKKRLRSLVVFSNQNEIRIRNAQIRKQVIRLDELENRIQVLEDESGLSPMSQETWKQTVSWFKRNCGENQLYEKILKRCSAEYSRLLHETPLGNCPFCKRAVYASDAEISDYCKCGMNLRKIYGNKISTKNLELLLHNSPVRLHPKNENRIFEISPEIKQKANFYFWKTKEYYLCPQCHQQLLRLSGLCQNCGMNLQSVNFGKVKFTPAQVKQLLIGETLNVSAEGENFIIFPNTEPISHKQIKFQWHYEEKK